MIDGWRAMRLSAWTAAVAGGVAGGPAGCADRDAAAAADEERVAAATPDLASMTREASFQELPDGVTPAMIAEGEQLFSGAGICVTCHGADATGLPNLGADLTDESWQHSDGSYEGILRTIREGVSAEASTSGVPMPPKGGTTIDDAQVRAVAAYVWSLRH